MTEELIKKLKAQYYLGEGDYEELYKALENNIRKVDNSDRDESFWCIVLDSEDLKKADEGKAKDIDVMICNDTLSGWFLGSMGRASNINGTRLVMEPVEQSDGYIEYHKNLQKLEEQTDAS